jgi:hypothetical protein
MDSQSRWQTGHQIPHEIVVICAWFAAYTLWEHCLSVVVNGLHIPLPSNRIAIWVGKHHLATILLGQKLENQKHESDPCAMGHICL